VIPMQQGIQTWVDLKKVSSSGQDEGGDGKSSAGQITLVQIPLMRKKNNTYEEIKELMDAGKVKEAKLCVRDSEWEVTDEIRSRLWPLLASIHEVDRSRLDGLYWDSVGQIFGSQGEFAIPNDLQKKNINYSIDWRK
jgi:hypothetical protein